MEMHFIVYTEKGCEVRQLSNHTLNRDTKQYNLNLNETGGLSKSVFL